MLRAVFKHLLPPLAGFTAVICAGVLQAQAAEIRGTVVAVEGSTVRIDIPRGSNVARGDPVVFRIRVPEIGLVSVGGEWRIKEVGFRDVLAEPIGSVETYPKRGYEAVIRPEIARTESPPETEGELPWRQPAEPRRPAEPRQAQSAAGYPPGVTPIPDDELPWLKSQRGTPPPARAAAPVQEEALPWREQPRSQSAPAPSAPAVAPGASPRLRRRISSSYTLVWKDSGSGADRDFATFRARAGGEFHPVGDVAISGAWESRGGDPHTPVFETVLVSGGRLAVRTPRAYQLIWNDSGSGADWDYALWEPIPPEGYVCPGHVGTRRHQPPPSPDAVRCVPAECAEPVSAVRKIWDSRGSYSDRDFSAWQSAYANLLLGNGGSLSQPPARPAYGIKEACFLE